MEDKLERALKELLVTHDMVVLPGFGAFNATDIPAMVDSKNNVIYPPRRKVSYDATNKADDGVLCTFYARQERISKETASQHIAEFVEEINHRLHRGNPWVIDSLGKFIIDGLDNLNFFPDPDQNFVPQSYGLPDIELTGAKPEYPDIQVPDPVFGEEEMAPKKGKKEKKKKEKKERKKSRLVLWISVLLLLGGGGAFAFFKLTDPGKQMADKLLAAAGLKKEQKEEPAPAEAKPSAETAVAEVYQPRNGQKSFDTPDRLDIEATQLDQFVKDSKSGVPEEKKEVAVPAKKEEKPKVAAVVKKEEPKKVAEPVKKTEPTKSPVVQKKTEPAKSTTDSKALANNSTAKPTTTKPVSGTADNKTTTASKTPANTAPKTTTPTPTPVKPVETKKTEPTKTESEEVIASGKAFRSNESIYSKFQIVVSEFGAIEDAVESSDRYARMGYNVAVIQFKDGRFGVCVARSGDRIKAEKYLRDVRTAVPSAKLRDY